jgi:predicted RNA-binding Zn-ribbon protein involved in translation (DUF1610 family)
MAAKDNKVEAACAVCRQRLRLPRHRVGTVECPRCGDRFVADTNTVILDDIDLGRFDIAPASTITYRLQKSRKNTGLLFVCFSIGILSPFLAIIYLVLSFFNDWHQTYLNDAAALCILSCISWLVLFLGGKRHYIDIEPTEVYSSKLDIAIKYRGVYDIVKFFEEEGAEDRATRQGNRYLHSTDAAQLPVPQGDVQKLHINSYEGKSIDISRDYTAFMEAINDLIDRRVAMAKASPVTWNKAASSPIRRSL